MLKTVKKSILAVKRNLLKCETEIGKKCNGKSLGLYTGFYLHWSQVEGPNYCFLLSNHPSSLSNNLHYFFLALIVSIGRVHKIKHSTCTVYSHDHFLACNCLLSFSSFSPSFSLSLSETSLTYISKCDCHTKYINGDLSQVCVVKIIVHARYM